MLTIDIMRDKDIKKHEVSNFLMIQQTTIISLKYFNCIIDIFIE